MSAPAVVVVVGSLNMDLVARAQRLPVPGETVAGRTFATVPGGKGANQAVAAARLGAPTAMIGCLGDDGFGSQLRAGLTADGIDCSGVRTVADVGARGVVSAGPGDVRHHPARAVEAVDTTAAGDTFIGGLCAALVRGATLEEAITFAQAAAAISVTRPGAQPSIPFEREVVVARVC